MAGREGRDGEVCDDGHENGAVLGLAPPGGPIRSLSQEVPVPFGMGIGMHWRPVSVYYWCQDAKMAILVKNKSYWLGCTIRADQEIKMQNPWFKCPARSRALFLL